MLPYYPGITAELVRKLFHYNPVTGALVRRITVSHNAKAGTAVGCPDSRGHLQVSIRGVLLLVHRVVWLHVHGAWPQYEIDHINGNKADNRIANLRDVPAEVNAQNRRQSNKGAKVNLLGVTQGAPGKFYAQIGHKGRGVYLGTFPSAAEAHQAYKVAKRKLHAGCTI